MSIPLFLDIEFCRTASHFFPTGIAWSLPDGRIKTTLVVPDDDWLPELAEDPDVDLQLLYEHGAPAIEVVREMNEDLADQTIYCDDLIPKEQLLDLLFSTVHSQPAFELLPLSDLIPGIAMDDFEDRRRIIMNEYELLPGLPETGVFVLQRIAVDAGLLGG